MTTMTLPDPDTPNTEFERPADRAQLERTASAVALERSLTDAAPFAWLPLGQGR
jgi:hypothetical protein